MSSNTIFFIICGQVGSGKTTFSKKFAEVHNAIRFTPDELMHALYEKIPSNDEFDDYYFRCCRVSWNFAKQIISKGINVVLDFGFWTKSMRDEYKQKIEELGYEYRLIYISTDNSVIKKRLKLRNMSPGFGEIVITDEMFDFFSPQFEPPSPGENAEVINNDKL